MASAMRAPSKVVGVVPDQIVPVARHQARTPERRVSLVALLVGHRPPLVTAPQGLMLLTQTAVVVVVPEDHRAVRHRPAVLAASLTMALAAEAEAALWPVTAASEGLLRLGQVVRRVLDPEVEVEPLRLPNPIGADPAVVGARPVRLVAPEVPESRAAAVEGVVPGRARAVPAVPAVLVSV